MQKVDKGQAEPRWMAVSAALAVGCLYLTLPEALTVGPGWSVICLVTVLTVPAVMAHSRGKYRLNEIFGYSILAVITAEMVGSLVLLIRALPTHKESPASLLRSAAALWITNVLVFASWYWRLDAGGPNCRAVRGAHTDGAFLFPQMIMDEDLKKATGEENWSPHFIDYLFLAFNTSTAFSPTDSPVLSRWAKVMMMVQSIISLAAIAVLGARAVNIL